ncbi:MAG TPA: cytosine permease [Mycobacteriales bacterium]|nr:cytosine permease [Mycobacteriales bacterium]
MSATVAADRAAPVEAPRTLLEEPPRALGLADQLGLWANLGITLTLPAAAGYVLLPGMSLLAALTAVVVGSFVGSALLALAAVPGARTGAPAMVLLRGVFGWRGSLLPTALNVVQCLGWTVVEVVIIATTAHGLAPHVPRWVFVVLAGAAATGLALRPLGVVRVLRRYAVWLVVAASVYLFVRVLARPLPAFTRGSWHGFAASLDLVIALPISWVPLAADYTRHARSGRAAGLGAFGGFGTACTAYFTLGVLAVAAYPNATDGSTALVALPAAGLALAVLVVDELDEAFANLYSTAVSTQNAQPSLDRRWLALGVGTVATGLAIGADYAEYESFLYLIGAVFVPLTAVFVIDYWVLRRGGWDTSKAAPRRLRMLVPWAAGFAAYELVAPTYIAQWTGWSAWWLHRRADLGFTAPPAWLSASLTALVVAGALTVLVGWRRSAP